MRFLGMILSLVCCVGSLYGFDETVLPATGWGHQIFFMNGRNPATGSLKSSFLHLLKGAFDLDLFIETGTYLGDTTAVAAEVFSKVETIELSETLYEGAKRRFSNTTVGVHLGDSAKILPELLPKLEGRALFYLDGHFSGGNTALGKSTTPILAELEAIKEAGFSDSVIMIDDIRLFQTSLYAATIAEDSPISGYPTIDLLIDRILEVNPEYLVAIFGDVFVAFPGTTPVSITPLFLAMMEERLFYSKMSEQELDNVEGVIAKANGYELEQIIEYHGQYASDELQNGFRSFSTLWKGLILQNAGKNRNAQALFSNAARRSCRDWPITRHHRY